MLSICQFNSYDEISVNASVFFMSAIMFAGDETQKVL